MEVARSFSTTFRVVGPVHSHLHHLPRGSSGGSGGAAQGATVRTPLQKPFLAAKTKGGCGTRLTNGVYLSLQIFLVVYLENCAWAGTTRGRVAVLWAVLDLGIRFDMPVRHGTICSTCVV